MDVVVIGSGISGLSSALILARHGRKVALVEQNARLAPLLSRFQRNGFWFDNGFHYAGGLHEGSAYRVLFRSMGLEDIFQEAVPMRPEGYDILALDDGRMVHLPCGLENMRDALTRAFPRSAEGIRTYIERIRLIHKETPFTNLDLSPEYPDLQAHLAATLESVLRKGCVEEDLLEALDVYNYCLTGLTAAEISIHLHAMVVASYYFSAHTFQRGGDSLVQAFERGLREAGVELHTSCRALSIETDAHRRVSGVRVRDASGNEETLECSACVFTAHPKILAALLRQSRVRRSYLARLQRQEDTFSPFVVYLETEQIPQALARANLYRFRRKAEAASRPFVALACDPADYGFGRKGLCLLREAWEHSDSKSCEGVSKGFCAKDSPGNSAAYEEYKQRSAQELVHDLLEVFPDLRGHVRLAEMATPCTYEASTGTFAGSIYGVKQLAGRMNLNGITPIRGLFLAGQSVLAPGVMGSVISAFSAAAGALGWDVVWREVQRWR